MALAFPFSIRKRATGPFRSMRMSPPYRGGRLRDRLVSLGVGGGDREEPVVGGHRRQRHLLHLAERERPLPDHRVRGPPVEHYVGDARVRGQLPAQPGVRRNRAGQRDLLGRRRRSRFYSSSASTSGTHSENSRAAVESLTPSCPSLFPAMSTLTIAITSTPSALRRPARCCDPIKPCSSPATTTRYTAIAGDWSF